ELSAIVFSDIPPSRKTSLLLDVRLDERERRAATQTAIDGPAGETVKALGAVVGPDTAFAALLVEHKAEASDDDALNEAVARLGGTEIAREPVDADRMSELAARLVAAARSGQLT